MSSRQIRPRTTERCEANLHRTSLASYFLKKSTRPYTGWHSLPELNRAFAVGETAFLTARRRERYNRNLAASSHKPLKLK